MNKLSREKSPYLRQHAENPVDWHPWNPASLKKASELNKPLFLSIGYATCHWCHVMAHESFEDPAAAELLNRICLPIKIDREELPHIDDYYMTAYQMLNGGGGWPLSIFAMPDGRPFVGATYVPLEDRGGRMGFKTLLGEIDRLWKEERPRIEKVAAELEGHLRRLNPDSIAPSAASLNHEFRSKELYPTALDAAEKQLIEDYDSEFGGFGTAPKFPSPHGLVFLLRRYRASGETQLLEMVETSLARMRAGGVYDQIGFGIHRYATDREWKLPHFEKMLYDQAGFLTICTELYQLTGKKRYRRWSGEILEYLQREMVSPDGAFYAAQDADSEGEEGIYYLWSLKELESLLDREELDSFIENFDLAREGNFTPEAGQPSRGLNILHSRPGNPPPAEDLRMRLLERRARRTPPLTDTKILSDWNGMMIAALAKAGRVFDDEAFIAAAEMAADTLLEKLGSTSGAEVRLYHRICEGEVQAQELLDDYAYLIRGLLELYQASFDPKRLSQSLGLARRAVSLFRHPAGGFSMAPYDPESIGGENRLLVDGAYPSGNSVMLENLQILYQLSGDARWEEILWNAIGALDELIRRQPRALLQALSTLQARNRGLREIVVCGEADNSATGALLAELRRIYLPESFLLFKPDGDDRLNKLLPFTAGMSSAAGKPRIYICRDRSCGLPREDTDAVLEELKAESLKI